MKKVVKKQQQQVALVIKIHQHFSLSFIVFPIFFLILILYMKLVNIRNQCIHSLKLNLLITGNWKKKKHIIFIVPWAYEVNLCAMQKSQTNNTFTFQKSKLRLFEYRVASEILLTLSRSGFNNFFCFHIDVHWDYNLTNDMRYIEST